MAAEGKCASIDGQMDGWMDRYLSTSPFAIAPGWEKDFHTVAMGVQREFHVTQDHLS